MTSISGFVEPPLLHARTLATGVVHSNTVVLLIPEVSFVEIGFVPLQKGQHAVPFGTGLLGGIPFQALRASLRSLSPYGTHLPP
ncbi:MAG TPA: hypothetical protein VE860_20405 [Chthoniobacterales bacterium]|nr:hypothetical protein [Chthoniobacterales bacterium]